MVFQHADVAGIEWALEQALGLYGKPADFAAAQGQAMREEFSWSKSAQAHLLCYAKAIRQKQI